MKRLVFLLASAALALVLSCGGAAKWAGEPPADYRVATVHEPKPEAMRGGVRATDRTLAGDTGGQHQVEIERKVVYTGWFTVDTYELKEAQNAFIDFATKAGGYMQSTSSHVVVIRIPAQRFADVEPLLRKLGRVDDTQTRIQAQDVTEQYFDLKLRLNSKKKYLENLYKLLENAGTLKDKLAVQKEIARVVEEIERFEGKLRYLSQQVAYATVTVTFRLAHSGPKRTFKLPWDWLDSLGLEYMIR
jgi:hypothetical protein